MKASISLGTPHALAIHELLLIRHGGAAGVRDEARLESAFIHASPDVVEMATAYCAGIVQNHPFVDGNKRTGFVVGILFLEMNGFEFTASEAEAAQAVRELAAGTINETGFAVFLRDHSKRLRKRAK